MLMQHMKEFVKDSKIVDWHIESKYSADMSRKSEVVSADFSVKAFV